VCSEGARLRYLAATHFATDLPGHAAIGRAAERWPLDATSAGVDCGERAGRRDAPPGLPITGTPLPLVALDAPSFTVSEPSRDLGKWQAGKRTGTGRQTAEGTGKPQKAPANRASRDRNQVAARGSDRAGTRFAEHPPEDCAALAVSEKSASVHLH
jgi:hypothetical protein